MEPRKATLALASSMTLAACTTLALQPNVPRSVTEHRLAAFDLVEECGPVGIGDRIDYRFESTAPVSFNIHYQEGNAVLIPISRENTTSDSGILLARIPA